MESKQIQDRLAVCGITVSTETAEKLAAYHALLMGWNQRMDLTAVTEEAEMLDRHYVDSLAPLAHPGLLPAQGRVIDVGTGAGFPGMVLAIACPEAKVTLLDSLGKRMKWLEEILPGLGISAQYVTARAEEAVADCREQYDFATSRAVARLNILLELTAPYVKVGGAVLAMKGTAAEEELAECAGAIKKLGLKLEEVRKFPIDGTSHGVIILRKVAPTPAKYPRRLAEGRLQRPARRRAGLLPAYHQGHGV